VGVDRTRIHEILALALRAVRAARQTLGEEVWQGLETALLRDGRPWHEAVLIPLGLAQEARRAPELRSRT